MRRDQENGRRFVETDFSHFGILEIRISATRFLDETCPCLDS